MFFFIPVSTDAPVYHWPFGTVGLIVVNVLIFFLLPNPEDYVLLHGQGLQPLQWVTSNFIHEGFFHLAGNMIFLWGFGLVVEGKLGWLRFVPVYLVIGIVQCFTEQFLMLGSEGGSSLGASAIIFGLMAISMVWAPKNELTIFVFAFFFRVFATTFEVSILSFGLFYIAKELLFSLLLSFQFSSQLLHLSGIAVGLGIGVLFVKAKWVDCEGWDLFTVMKNEHGSAGLAKVPSLLPEAEYQLESVSGQKIKRKKRKKKLPDDDYDVDQKSFRREKRREKGLDRLRELLAQNKPNAALSEYQNTKSYLGEFTLGAPVLEQLGNALYRQKLYEEVVPIFEEYIKRFPELADSVRVKLAAILIEKQQRPRAALRALSTIAPDALPDEIEKTRLKIERKANQLIEQGVLEIEQKPW